MIEDRDDEGEEEEAEDDDDTSDEKTANKKSKDKAWGRKYPSSTFAASYHSADRNINPKEKFVRIKSDLNLRFKWC